MVHAAMAKVKTISIGAKMVFDGFEVEAFLAGHVIGAAMFHVQFSATAASVLYTGDYNTTADRHLSAANMVPKLRPTLLITESTYATTIRASKRNRELHFLRQVHRCIRRGGRVLIPVFALGRVQELCLLLDSYWERMKDELGSVPIYHSAGTNIDNLS